MSQPPEPGTDPRDRRASRAVRELIDAEEAVLAAADRLRKARERVRRIGKEPRLQVVEEPEDGHASGA
jgi:hypothetical protein